ncbi:MAG TPA: NAD(P)-dependent alcohol dehydrogenase [Actinospica sp.]|jgi:propanol-preferring alcohol dehydrogenase|nr:NAD(P)-dependent alcohol dehydrogenase [Actinospica sp.]
MRAIRLTGRDRGAPVLTEVDRPVPRGAEVLVRVEAVGICRSDIHVIDAASGALPFEPPFTLGHEIAGRVVEAGPLALLPSVGLDERVAVYGPWGCGTCRNCAAGAENYCERRGAVGWTAGAGLGRDGGMAEFILVPSGRHLLPIGELDPCQAAPLCDAGLTSYHAIAGIRAALGPDSTVVVIGVGGLGHVAIQILRALTPSRVVAVDTREEAVALAYSAGAHAALLAPSPGASALKADGVDAVLDFVGTDGTIALAASVLRPRGELVLVGSGGGSLTVAKSGRLPQGFRLALPYWGTRSELVDVLDLARSGAIEVETETFPLSEAVDAIERLRAGTVNGRAVIVPD